ncbi:MAG: DUF4202 domain-containing protein [Acidobacteria bacterium]|nr:DUF4202 domain-containing protein [Acidobacteriota bacterium]
MRAVPDASVLPSGRAFSEEFLRLRALAIDWTRDYYDRSHLLRTGDWLLALDPRAPEPLVIAALTHDMERTVPGGPVLDKANTPWDDPAYNAAHCARSAHVVASWLTAHAASERFVQGIRTPILEHEFGGSAEGDLMQAADSISFLETNRGLVVGWVEGGECSVEKGQAKMQWMCDRVRLERARAVARAQLEAGMAEIAQRLAEA